MSKSTSIKGDISIHTQNIFPIIKKWLYSDREIFIRELISNSFDAITKLKKISNTDSSVSAPNPGRITLQIDKKKKTLTIEDNGIGMSESEIQKYINQIAFSGAEDFLKKHQDDEKKQDIIGHFGLGFYSSFMVADKVEIETKSYKKSVSPAKWSCKGSTKFEISKGNKKETGTSVILHLNEEHLDFLEESKLTALVQKYANFLPVEIAVGETVVNDQNPLWTESPKEVTEEAYKSFYQTLFPMQQEPLFWIHLNVDYPFRLQGILYFPKVMHELDSSKGRIKLFCQQVFVTDKASDIVPEFLTLLQGTLDCPDIPLNVSRSALQNDPYVQKISKHIVKKIADKLTSLHANDSTAFETYWKDIHPFIKYGMMNDHEFYEKVKSSVIFESSEGGFTTLSDYQSANDEKTDKSIIYSTDKAAQNIYISLLKEKGIPVILLDAVIDSHFIQFLESKDSSLKFKSVESSTKNILETTKDSEKIIDPEIEDVFKKALGKDTLKIETKTLSSPSVSVMISQDEHAKRFKEMSRMMKGNAEMGGLFNEHTLIINQSNPIIKNIMQSHKKSPHNDSIKLLCEQLYDIARLSHEPLGPEEMQAFVKRSTQLLETASHPQ